MKMAVQMFDVFKVFFGNLRSKFANLGGGDKKTLISAERRPR